MTENSRRYFEVGGFGRLGLAHESVGSLLQGKQKATVAYGLAADLYAVDKQARIQLVLSRNLGKSE